jgi:hypothetical protein
MGRGYRILDSGHILEVWAGRITQEDLLEGERRELEDPNLPSAPRVLVDITRASFDPSIQERELGQLVDIYLHFRNKIAGARVAIVAGKEFEKASLYGRLAGREKINVIVFITINTACVWLGVNELEVREWVKRTQAELLESPPPGG